MTENIDQQLYAKYNLTEDEIKFIEKMFESRQPGAFNDELLTDKEVAHILKVSRRTL